MTEHGKYRTGVLRRREAELRANLNLKDFETYVKLVQIHCRVLELETELEKLEPRLDKD